MARYIDADNFRKTMIKRFGCIPCLTDYSEASRYDIPLDDALDLAPTADVAEVVRCKDCKHWCIQEGNDINQSYFCSRDKMWCMPTRKADDFCSYGERKE